MAKVKLEIFGETKQDFIIKIPHQLIKKFDIQENDKGKFKIDTQNKTIKLMGVN